MAVATVPRGKARKQELDPPAVGRHLEHIRVDQVDVGENARIQPGELDELAASIKELGVLQPVRAIGPHRDGRYKLVWGQRRLLAAKQAGLELIPVLVDPVGDDVDHPGAKRSIEQLVENLQRADLNPIDEAKALRQVLDADPELTQDELAKRLGRSAPWVSNTLRVLNTAPEVQQLLNAGKLTLAHVKAIAGLDVGLQPALAERAANNSWSAHDVERNVKWEKDNAAQTRKHRAAAEKSAKEAIEQLDKVANRKTAKVGIARYSGADVTKVLEADGWTVVGDGWRMDVVKNAGECGCDGVWRVEIPYNESGKVKLAPACNSAEHKAARQKAREETWARQRKADNEKREKERQEAIGRAERVAVGLQTEVDTPFGKRLLINALVTGSGLEDDLLDQYANGGQEEVEDTVERESDETWRLIESIPDADLNKVVARAVAESLDDHWRSGPGIRNAVAARWPAPEPENTAAKPKKAAAAAKPEE